MGEHSSYRTITMLYLSQIQYNLERWFNYTICTRKNFIDIEQFWPSDIHSEKSFHFSIKVTNLLKKWEKLKFLKKDE